MTLPNAISLARLLAVPILVTVSLNGWYQIAIALFVLAALSDAIDGWLARRLDHVSRLGSLLDPLADKALLVSVFVLLGWQGHVPAWLVILVVFRDGLLLAGWLTGQFLLDAPGQSIRPHWTSKVNTCAQFLLAGGTLALLAGGETLPAASTAFAFFVALTTLVSGAVYIGAWMRGMSQADGA